MTSRRRGESMSRHNFGAGGDRAAARREPKSFDSCPASRASTRTATAAGSASSLSTSSVGRATAWCAVRAGVPPGPVLTRGLRGIRAARDVTYPAAPPPLGDELDRELPGLMTSSTKVLIGIWQTAVTARRCTASCRALARGSYEGRRSCTARTFGQGSRIDQDQSLPDRVVERPRSVARTRCRLASLLVTSAMHSATCATCTYSCSRPPSRSRRSSRMVAPGGGGVWLPGIGGWVLTEGSVRAVGVVKSVRGGVPVFRPARFPGPLPAATDPAAVGGVWRARGTRGVAPEADLPDGEDQTGLRLARPVGGCSPSGCAAWHGGSPTGRRHRS